MPLCLILVLGFIFISVSGVLSSCLLSLNAQTAQPSLTSISTAETIAASAAIHTHTPYHPIPVANAGPNQIVHDDFRVGPAHYIKAVRLQDQHQAIKTTSNPSQKAPPRVNFGLPTSPIPTRSSITNGSINHLSGPIRTVSLIPVGKEPAGIAFDSANGTLYVINSGDNTVSVISGQTNKVIGNPIPVGNHPQGIAFDSANGTLYVINSGDNTL